MSSAQSIGKGSHNNTYLGWKRNRFTTMPFSLVEFLVKVQIGRNSWAVIARLCRCVYEDGSLGVVPRGEMSKDTGLTYPQIARGMMELKEKLVIEPVKRLTYSGRLGPDRSNYGHVAQYRFTAEVMRYIAEDISFQPKEGSGGSAQSNESG